MAEPYRDNPIRKSLEARALFFYAEHVERFWIFHSLCIGVEIYERLREFCARICVYKAPYQCDICNGFAFRSALLNPPTPLLKLTSACLIPKTRSSSRRRAWTATQAVRALLLLGRCPRTLHWGLRRALLGKSTPSNRRTKWMSRRKDFWRTSRLRSSISPLFLGKYFSQCQTMFNPNSCLAKSSPLPTLRQVPLPLCLVTKNGQFLPSRPF